VGVGFRERRASVEGGGDLVPPEPCAVGGVKADGSRRRRHDYEEAS
jgi:hypothetical protein